MARPDPASVWIFVDMEGIGGVAAYSQVMMHGVEYERARTWMAQEVLLVMVRIAPSAVPPEQ